MELLDKIDLMIGEKHTRAKRRKKAREEEKKRQRGSFGVKADKQAQKKYMGHGSIKDLANEGTDDFTGVVTKSLPYYMKGVKVSIITRGNTFYAGISGGPIGPVEKKTFKNKDDAMKWFSGHGIKEIQWDKGKGKAKF